MNALADSLEALARRPLRPRRELLLHLAARLRALDAVLVAEREQLAFGLEEVA
jgi:hypothetical protein